MTAARVVFALFTLAIGVLTIWLHALRLPFLRVPIGDAAYEVALARGLIEHVASGPFWSAPGYAAFLALIERLSGGGAVLVAVLQLLLLMTAVTMTVALAERWFDRPTAWLAGLLLCASAGPLFLVTKLLPEGLSLLLTVAFLAFALEAGGRHRTPQEIRDLERLLADGAPPPKATRRENVVSFLAGVAGGLASVVTPWVGYAVIAAGLGLFQAGLRGWRGRTPALWLFLGAFAAVTPTTIHNARAGALALVSTGGGFDVWLAVGPGASGPGPAELESPVIQRAVRSVAADSLERSELGAPLDPGHRQSWWSTRALRELLSSPGPGLSRLVLRWRAFAAGPEPEAAGDWRLERRRLPWLNLLVVPFPALLLLGLLGLGLAGGGAGLPRGFCATRVAPIALVCAALLGVGFSPDPPRSRVVLIPLLALFGAHALRALDRLWGPERRSALLLTAFLCGGTALLWSGPGGVVDHSARAASLYVAAGNGFEATGRDSAAREAWREALVFDPSRVEAALRLSQQALRLRDLAGAIAPLEAVVKSVPRNFDLRNNLGILYYQALREHDAERELEVAARLRPREAGPWFYRGLVAQREGRLAAADSLYGAAIARDPRFLGAWIRRVDNQLAAGNERLALAWADSAAARGIALPNDLARRVLAAAGGVRN